MQIRIATAPCSWGVFYADGSTSGTPYETFLRQAAEAGYKEIELGPDGYLPQDVQTLQEKLAQVGLSVCAGTATVPFGLLTAQGSKDFVTALAQRLVSLHVRDMVVMDGTAYEPGTPAKADWDQAMWDRIYENILAVNDYLRDSFGLRMVFHPHAGTAIEYDSEIERMLSQGDIYLCFDTGHHVFANGGTKKGDKSVLEFLAKHSDRVAYLHFKNMDGQVRERSLAEGWSVAEAFQKDVMCNLSDGVIDFEELRDALQQMDFRGTAVIEQDMYGRTAEYAFSCAKVNLLYLRRIGMIASGAD